MREQGESDAGRYRARDDSMKLLVIDNYDSFTYNLVQLFGEMDVDLVVKRNDETSVDEVKKMKPDRICISPGPGRPENTGISSDLIRELGPGVPILGVQFHPESILTIEGRKLLANFLRVYAPLREITS